MVPEAVLTEAYWITEYVYEIVYVLDTGQCLVPVNWRQKALFKLKLNLRQILGTRQKSGTTEAICSMKSDSLYATKLLDTICFPEGGYIFVI